MSDRILYLISIGSVKVMTWAEYQYWKKSKLR